MQLTFARTELSKPRWIMDMVVSSIAASGFYLYIVWMTRMFEVTPLKPEKLLGDVLMIVLAYTLSVFAGHILMKKGWSSLVWVSLVGSTIFALIRIGVAVPGSIEHYYRFRPDEPLLTFLIWPFALILFSTAVALSVVTLVASLIARVLRSLLDTGSDAR